MVKKPKPDLRVEIGSCILENPVMVASGTFGYAEEFKGFMDLRKLGAIVTKTITVKPRSGNLPPRTCETPSGMLNSVGLENPGIGSFIKEKIPFLEDLSIPIIVSIASEDKPDEFLVLAELLDRIKAVSAIELNISCPNIKKDRLISQDASETFNLVKAVRGITGKCLITKLSPNVTSVPEIALAAQEAGSEAVALVNTFIGMSIDIHKRASRINSLVGGLSGPAIRPLAVRMVWEVYNKIKVPIIGMGGIMDIESAIEFVLAGATAVSTGTANFIDPAISLGIVSGLRKHMEDNNIADLREIRGKLKICAD
ncbi:MAG: dihydroorotate dehydrogenase [Candidatus Omnitrophica bacterium]|nr:dihydroorotate dehydrogenase [Candidatus Omnitrophota bacterium]MDD5771265.1 dihydroorotate dehydrogenase [Candidatus Omnitrophota bacterium]